MRREWLTGIIRDVHVASRGMYGYRRVHAELTHGPGVFARADLVNLLMHNADIAPPRTNHHNLQLVFRRSLGCKLVQPKNCWLVYRLCSGFTTCRERP